jgi:hypothetical protein
MTYSETISNFHPSRHQIDQIFGPQTIQKELI